MASFQDRAQHTIAQLDKEVSCLCVSSTGSECAVPLRPHEIASIFSAIPSLSNPILSL